MVRSSTSPFVFNACAMTNFHIYPETPADLPILDTLSDKAFGPGRFVRTAHRVREGVAPVPQLSLTVWHGGQLAGGVRFTAVRVGDCDGGLLLGPLVVDPALAGKGYGRALVQEGLDRAREAGFSFVLLVGDLSYYSRFGFTQAGAGRIVLPGPVDPTRLLAVELREGALRDAAGTVAACAA